MQTLVKDTLFYDGQCPLCSREIKLLGKLTKGSVIFQDIHEYWLRRSDVKPDDREKTNTAYTDDSAIPSVNPSTPANSSDVPNKQAMLQVLHLQQADGQWLRGLEANTAVWKHTPFRLLINIFNLPGVKQVARAVYTKWAQMRYQRIYSEQQQSTQHCACKAPNK